MKITSLDSVDSTQLYLKRLLHSGEIIAPHAVVASIQNAGVGSRDNEWNSKEGNLFLSFAINMKDLPSDLKLESSSIYFSYLLKEVFSENGSKVWLKWPNDFYVDDLKIGGMITNIVKDNLVCGVGINLVDAPKNFGKLDIDFSKNTLLKKYFHKIEKKISWKQIFSKYEIEFCRNQDFFTHINDQRVSLNDATLLDDGSININGKRVYSTR